MSVFLEEQYDCIVIGAGVAGLACAKKILEKEGEVDRTAKILVLEAQSYIGGRVKQSDDFITGAKVELGAEILHGAETLLTEFAKEKNELITEEYCWAHGDGGPLERPANNGYGLYYLGKVGEESAQQQPRLLRYDDTDEDFVRLNEDLWDTADLKEEDFDESLSLKDYLISKGHTEQMIELASAGFSNTLCTNLEELSFRQTIRWNRIWNAYGDGEFKLDRSYACLIDYLKEGLEIKLDQPVDTVTFESSGNGAEGGHGSQSVVVTTTQGLVARAKTVVLTCSPHVVKAGLIKFDPPLPEQTVKALHYTKMHPAMKVFLKFSRCVWPRHLAGMIIADKESLFPDIWFRVVSEDPVEGESASDQSAACYATGFATAHYAERLRSLPEEEVYSRLLAQLDKIFSLLEPKHMNPICPPRDESSGARDESVSEYKEGCAVRLVPSSFYLGGMIQCWDVTRHPFIGGGKCD